MPHSLAPSLTKTLLVINITTFIYTYLNCLDRHRVTNYSFLYFAEIVSSPPEETTCHFLVIASHINKYCAMTDRHSHTSPSHRCARMHTGRAGCELPNIVQWLGVSSVLCLCLLRLVSTSASLTPWALRGVCPADQMEHGSTVLALKERQHRRLS